MCLLSHTWLYSAIGRLNGMDRNVEAQEKVSLMTAAAIIVSDADETKEVEEKKEPHKEASAG